MPVDVGRAERGPTRLLVLPCSARKNTAPSRPIAAWWRYDGSLIRLCRRLERDRRFPPDVRVRILSAKHGVILPSTPLTWYDCRMDSRRAAEMRTRVADALCRAVEEEDACEVFLALGRYYCEAASLFAPPVPVHRPVLQIGSMQREVKRWLLSGERPMAGQLTLFPESVHKPGAGTLAALAHASGS